MKHLKIHFATMFVALLCLADSDAKVVYVNATAPAGGSGTTWTTACRYLQDALDLTVAGDEVWVAAGTYYPDQGALVTTGDRTASFTLKQDVKIFGGFVGGETALRQRNPETNITLLSGEIWPEKAHWSLHVVSLVGNAIIDGFTVSNGNANGEISPYHQGGGIWVMDTKSLTVNNCVLSNNFATSSGGAIRVYGSDASATITNSSFYYNSALNGGGIYCARQNAGSGLSVRNCLFRNNFSTTTINGNGGGAIRNESKGSIETTDCAFENNSTTSSGGAINNDYNSSLIVKRCRFSGNQSAYGLYSRGGAIATYDLTLSDSLFLSNTAVNGGAVYAPVKVSIYDCIFSENIATKFANIGNSGDGGALHMASNVINAEVINTVFSHNTSQHDGGAVFVSRSDSGTSLKMFNCAFISNTSVTGGALCSSNYTTSVSVDVGNCTFYGNVATGTTSGKNHGDSFYANNIIKFHNSIIYDGSSVTRSSIYLGPMGQLRNYNSNFPTPSNRGKNIIERGVAAITAETGAILDLDDTTATILSDNPVFVDHGNPIGADGIWKTSDDGLRLQASSPAIDRGFALSLPADAYDLDNDGDLLELIPVDLAGYTRIQRAALDLGAYEAGDADLPIEILTQPVNLTQLRDLTVTFTVTATGYALKYQWYLGNRGDVSNPVTGAIGNSYTTPGLTTTTNYWVRVSNELGFVDSETATVTVFPIIITTQPANTVVAPGATAELSVTASGRDLKYQWYQGASGNTGNPITGAVLANFTSPTLAETTSFWVRITNPYGAVDSATTTVTVAEDPVMMALNTSGTTLFYTAGGNAPWFAQSTTTHDGYAAGQSGVITHSQISDIQTSVTGAGTISFWWNVSSQSGGDYLRFYIDGVLQSGSISGTTGTWAKKTFPVATTGPHTFKWSYTKNSSTTSGSDCGWVDEVTWVPTLITTQPTGRSILSGTSVDLEVAASGSGLSYQWFEGDSGVTTTLVPGANSPTFTTPALNSTTKFWVRVGNGVGFESSAAAAVTVYPANAALAAAVNSGPALSFFTWGDLPWTVQSATTHDGVTALQSGAIAHSQASRTEAVVSGPGTLSFWWKTSSELGFDFVKFRVDGVEQGSLSGESGWQQVTISVVGPGNHRLSWTYEKDASKTSGSDQAWMDQVSWQGTETGTTYAGWASLHNLTGEDALSTANPSRDGVNNLIKYALELDPEVPTFTPTDGVNPGLPRMEVSEGTMTFTFIKDTAKSDLTYTVESCTDLNDWSPVTTGVAETPLAGTLVRIVVTIPINGQQFCRLKVTK